MSCFAHAHGMGIEDVVVEGGSGLLSRTRLLAHGFNDAEIGSARERGDLIRLHRGVYALGRAFTQSTQPLDLLRIIGVAGRSPGMVISHASAAVLHDIPLWGVDASEVHLTRAGRGGSARTPGRVLHAAALADVDVTELQGVTVTSLSRTLVDLARSTSFESAVVASDNALHRWPGLARDLAAEVAASARRPGNRAARRALAFADGRAESPGESRARVLLHRLGVDRPDLQIEVFDRDGAFLGRSDHGYPDDGLLIEFDGMAKYAAPHGVGMTGQDVLAAEKRREDAIRGVGCTVLRIVWSELGRPQWLGFRVAELRRQGRAMRTSGASTGSFRTRPPIRVDLQAG